MRIRPLKHAHNALQDHSAPIQSTPLKYVPPENIPCPVLPSVYHALLDIIALLDRLTHMEEHRQAVLDLGASHVPPALLVQVP